MKKGRFLGATMMILLCVPSWGAERRDETSLPPAREIGVLFLPPLDATPEATNMRAPRQLVIRHRIQFELIARQFTVLGETLAAQAANAVPTVDLSSLSARTAENLDLLGERTGANWVVSLVVQHAEANSNESGGFSVETRILVQVRDARRHLWLSDRTVVGKAEGAGSPVMVFMHSLDNATKRALADIVGEHPAVVPVEMEDSLADYLAGQTSPFVGEPNKPVTAGSVR